MDATWWLCLCPVISHFFVIAFFASLFCGLDDVASRSPAAWKRMEFLTAILAEGNWFLVGTVSSLSMASVFEFMVVASSMDSLVLARLVMAQSTVVAVILLFQGYFLQAGVSFIPFLPAIYAMHNSLDKLYHYMPLASVSSFEVGTEKRSKTGGQNQNVANTTQMAIKVTNTVDVSATVAEKGLASVEDKCVVDLKYFEEGEGFCGSKSNAGCGD
ncbi:uncharacterized protein LOC131308001 isoform X2 [Rhododendron vialii]|uniref:uncharacterized protein LOC131308001 isoform X2 n=1 Tax=Rhododendron vialii TaxID=182163 RepID=UPI00265D86F3|nr:uncharacterized protein LOC131308001 isoform X2 [Rhododendron vialii]